MIEQSLVRSRDGMITLPATGPVDSEAIVLVDTPSSYCEIGSLPGVETQLAKYGDRFPSNEVLVRRQVFQSRFRADSPLQRDAHAEEAAPSPEHRSLKAGCGDCRKSRQNAKQSGQAAFLSAETSSAATLLSSVLDFSFDDRRITTRSGTESLTMPPMLVELAEFPGFDPSAPTPLPAGLSAKEHLQMVTAAQPDLRRKPSFKQEWAKVFHAKVIRNIFQDYYWWFFLQRFQPKVAVQGMLFDRISDNYVTMLQSVVNPAFRDKILQRLPDCLAQAVYATFSHAFPTSWKQFDANFKIELLSTIVMWMTGTKPLPYNWMAWPYDGLDSPLMKKSVAEQEMAASEEKRKVNPTVEVIQALKQLGVDKKKQHHLLVSSHQGHQTLPAVEATSSHRSRPFHSQSSPGSLHHGNRQPAFSKVSVQRNSSQLRTNPLASQAKQGGSEKTQLVHSVITGASPSKSGPRSSMSSNANNQVQSESNQNSHQRKRTTNDATDPSRPMISQSVVCFDEESVFGGDRGNRKQQREPFAGLPAARTQKNRSRRLSMYRAKRHTPLPEVEYVPATAAGTEYEKCLFDVSGHSPLVQHYMHLNGLVHETGLSYALQRTQVQKIPSEDSSPMKERLQEVTVKLDDIKGKLARLKEVSQAEGFRTDRLLRETRQDMAKRVESLLQQKEDVKMLSDRIFLETQQDQASVALSAIVLGGQNTAAKAVAAALEAQAIT